MECPPYIYILLRFKEAIALPTFGMLDRNVVRWDGTSTEIV